MTNNFRDIMQHLKQYYLTGLSHNYSVKYPFIKPGVKMEKLWRIKYRVENDNFYTAQILREINS